MGGRVSGHVRIKRTRMRVGDNAQLAQVSFVDTLVRTGKPDDAPVKKTVAAKATTAKPAAKTVAKKAPAKKPVAKKEAK